MTHRSCAVLWLLVTVAYLAGLGSAPMHVGGDEAQFATHAHAVASTGHDLNGRFLPLFFNITDPLVPEGTSAIWYQPVLFYLMALFLKFLPVSEWAIRLPTATIGIFDGLLIYFVAKRILLDRMFALLAALMLMLAPAHFIFSRQALDYLRPLPFVLGWMWCLVRFTDTNSAWPLLGASSLLYRVRSAFQTIEVAARLRQRA